MKVDRAQLKLHHRWRYALRRILGYRRFPHWGIPNRIIKNFEDYQAEAPDNCRIQLIREGYEANLPPPVVESDLVQAEFSDDQVIRHPPFRLVTLQNIHLRSRNMLLLTPDQQRVFLESSRTAYNLDYVKARECWQQFPCTRKNGSYFLAFNRWGYNYYYHWVVDTLSRFAALDAVPERTKIILPRKTRTYMQRSLELLGIPSERCVYFDDTDWQLDECWFAARGYTPLKPSAREVTALRRKLCTALGPAPKGKRRLYISRAHCATRQLLNEEEVHSLLAASGFERFFPEDHDLDSQINAFRSAEVVVGSFGSGLTNIMFCAPDTPVYVFYDHSYFDSCIWILGNCVGLNMQGLGYEPDQPIPLDTLKTFLGSLSG